MASSDAVERVEFPMIRRDRACSKSLGIVVGFLKKVGKKKKVRESGQ